MTITAGSLLSDQIVFGLNEQIEERHFEDAIDVCPRISDVALMRLLMTLSDGSYDVDDVVDYAIYKLRGSFNKFQHYDSLLYEMVGLYLHVRALKSWRVGRSSLI